MGAHLTPATRADAHNAAVELATGAWLHAKQQKSQSAKTRTAYEALLRVFRDHLRGQGLDLDAADPRRVRVDLTAAAAGRGEEPQIPQLPHATRALDGPSDSTVEDVAAQRAAAMALVAQAYAAQPVSTRYGRRAVAPSTANLRLAVLSSFYSYALRYDLLRGVNPIARVERQRVHAYAGARPLPYDDVRERLTAIDRTTPAGLRDAALLLVGLYTGRRLSELAGMRREHLTIRRAGVAIVWPRCKGNKQMHDELPRGGPQGTAGDALVAWVAHLYGEEREGEGLFHRAVVAANEGAQHGQRQAQRPIWISLARNQTVGHPLSLRAIANLCERRLGTSKVHTLRHTFARALEEAGAKVSEIQAFLGHADLGTTGRYLAQLHRGENRHLARLGALYGVSPQSDTAPHTD